MEYVKAKRAKRTTVTFSLLVSSAAVVLTGLLFSFVQFGQKKHIDNLTKDISKELTALRSTPDLDKILTIQNQLASLPDLHARKPAVSRLFTYIQQVTPIGVAISSLELDLQNSSIKATGTADDLAKGATLADTYKFAEYITGTGNEQTKTKIFSNVVSTLARDEKGVTSYTITANYDPKIFDNTVTLAISVPSTITTRSVLNKPASIFTEQGGN
jgi:hypothetical protein